MEFKRLTPAKRKEILEQNLEQKEAQWFARDHERRHWENIVMLEGSSPEARQAIEAAERDCARFVAQIALIQADIDALAHGPKA